MKHQRLITTEKTLSENEIVYLNEKFIQTYCRKKNWNPNELTPSQILEITINSKYKKFRS
jgi:hypothetical protein